MREQNLQKRFSLRTGQSKFESNESKGQVPIDIDHSQRKITCHFCRKPGHHIKDCRLRKRTHEIHSAEVEISNVNAAGKWETLREIAKKSLGISCF